MGSDFCLVEVLLPTIINLTRDSPGATYLPNYSSQLSVGPLVRHKNSCLTDKSSWARGL